MVYAIMRNLNPSFSKKYKADKLRLKYAPNNNGWKTVISNEYGYISKKFFPYHFDQMEKENFIDSHWISINSPYDCTGRAFTVSIDMYEIDGGTWVYHRKALDI